MEKTLNKLNKLIGLLEQGKVTASMQLELIKTCKSYIKESESYISELEQGVFELSYKLEMINKRSEKLELLLSTLGISFYQLESMNFDAFMQSSDKRTFFSNHRKTSLKCLKAI